MLYLYFGSNTTRLLVGCQYHNITMSDFPTKQNPKLCKNNCGTKIYLSDKKQKGSYLPYELDDVVHDCPKKQALKEALKSGTFIDTTSTPGQEKEVKLTPEQKELTVQELIARLDKAGIHIDVNTIMNPKKDQTLEQK